MANAFFSPQIKAQLETANAKQNLQAVGQLAPVQTFMQSLMAAGQTSGRLIGGGVAGLAGQDPLSAIDPAAFQRKQLFEQEQQRQNRVGEIFLQVQRELVDAPAHEKSEALLQRAGPLLNGEEKLKLGERIKKEKAEVRTELREDRELDLKERRIKNTRAYQREQLAQSDRHHYDGLQQRRLLAMQKILADTESDKRKGIEKAVADFSNTKSVRQYDFAQTSLGAMERLIDKRGPQFDQMLIAQTLKAIDPDSALTLGEMEAFFEAATGETSARFLGLSLRTLRTAAVKGLKKQELTKEQRLKLYEATRLTVAAKRDQALKERSRYQRRIDRYEEGNPSLHDYFQPMSDLEGVAEKLYSSNVPGGFADQSAYEGLGTSSADEVRQSLEQTRKQIQDLTDAPLFMQDLNRSRINELQRELREGLNLPAPQGQ